MAELVVPRYVIFCEGKRLGHGGRKPSFDVGVYRTIFGRLYPEVEFVPLGGTSEVQSDGKTFGLLLNRLAPGIKSWKVLDRDDRHDIEVRELSNEGVQVLPRRDLENFLWDDEIIRALCVRHGAAEQVGEILSEKEMALADILKQGRPADDIKAVAGRLYNKCKQSLRLNQCGNDAESFALLTLAPLVVPGTRVFDELKEAVLGPCSRWHE